MKTALYCVPCGKRCGTAWRGDGVVQARDADGVVHEFGQPAGRVLIAGRFKLAADPGWVDQGAVMAADLEQPDHWPVVWRCPECRETVGLDRPTALRVGFQTRLVLSSMSSNNLT